jgi:hypothetical protein
MLPYRRHRVLYAPSEVVKFNFLPGGKHAISAHKDDCIRLWDLTHPPNSGEEDDVGVLLASHYVGFPIYLLNFKVERSKVVVVATCGSYTLAGRDSNKAHAVLTFTFDEVDKVSVDVNWISGIDIGERPLESRIQDEYAVTLGHGSSLTGNPHLDDTGLELGVTDGMNASSINPEPSQLFVVDFKRGKAVHVATRLRAHVSTLYR